MLHDFGAVEDYEVSLLGRLLVPMSHNPKPLGCRGSLPQHGLCMAVADVSGHWMSILRHVYGGNIRILGCCGPQSTPPKIWTSTAPVDSYSVQANINPLSQYWAKTLVLGERVGTSSEMVCSSLGHQVSGLLLRPMECLQLRRLTRASFFVHLDKGPISNINIPGRPGTLFCSSIVES